MRIPLPGPGRITLVLLFVVPAVLGYPWHAGVQRWTLGVAVAATVLLLGRWRGQYLTTMTWRRITMGRNAVDASVTPDVKTTVVLRVAGESDAELPLDVIGSYLQRYGIRADAVRVTSRHTAGKTTTWIGVTVSAAANLAALQARSSVLPLQETAETVLRRMADHLRELGWVVNTTDPDVPDLLGPRPKQHWRAVQDGTLGYVAAYTVHDGVSPDEVLPRVRSLDVPEVWTALEMTGSVDRPEVAVACAVRSETRPAAAPLEMLRACDGEHRRALTALHPATTRRLVRT